MSSKQIEELFHRAVELNAGPARAEFLDRACAHDADLRKEVEKLLKSYEASEDFLEQALTLPIEELLKEEFGDTQSPMHNRSTISIDELPCQFGDYELIEKIAHGGMGVIFKARQQNLNRIVALKMILSGQLAGADEVQRFYVEAEAAGNLDHPGIVPVFDVGCIQDQHYFCMAYIDGQDLGSLVKQSTFEPHVAAALICKVCAAIQAAHDKGIVHRDLKPGNILLDGNSEPRITDFGLAKRIESDSQLTQTGMVLGTPSYMPPEQAAGLEIDSSADIYSIGAILYAMLTGTPPFKGKSQLETIMMVIENEPSSLRQINTAIPKDLDAICLKCLEKKPSDRYSSAGELREDLERYLSGEPIEAKKGLKRRIRRWSIREPALVAHIAATMVILVLLVFNYWVFGHRGDGREFNLRVLKWNWGILCGWVLVLFVLQKAQNFLRTKYAIPLTWSISNSIFLTIALAINAPPRELLISSYFVLIAASCLFRRAELVLASTIGSLVGFSLLVLWFFDSMGENLSYLLVFGVNMGVVGAILGSLTLRIKRLSEKNRA